MGFRIRHKPVRRASPSSRALDEARRAARLSLAELGRALKLNSRTIRRWELGEAHPQERQWAKVLAFYAERSPGVASHLAEATGRALPPLTTAADPRRVAGVLAAAADTLDVAPKRVREVLRAVAHAASEAGVPFDQVLLGMTDG